MRFPWQGLHVLEAGAPGAGACHRCAATRPGARYAGRSVAPAPSRWGCTVARARAADARAQPRPSLLGRGQAPDGPPRTVGLSRHIV